MFYNLILDSCVITRTRFFLRDKRLFEITEVEIKRVDCTSVTTYQIVFIFGSCYPCNIAFNVSSMGGDRDNNKDLDITIISKFCVKPFCLLIIFSNCTADSSHV